MSSYSFSPQFYQHWTSAPQAVRAAIVQELTDITTLLQTDTPFEEFVFSNHDLDAHLDDLYSAHDKQQAVARELADKEAAQKAEAEQQRLTKESLEKERLEQQRLQEEKLQAKKNALEEEALAEAEQQVSQETQVEQPADKQDLVTEVTKVAETAVTKTAVTDTVKNEVDKDSDKSLAETKPNLANVNNINTIGDTAHAHSAIDLSLQDTELDAVHQQMIQELEANIDDYLTEQMMQMSENLKSWLRAEVTRQLSEK